MIQRIRQILGGYPDEIVFAYIFGSAAKGKVNTLSDLDLAIFVQDPVRFSFNRKLQLHADLCRALLRDDIDLVILNQTRNLILRDTIIRTGRLIYDQDKDTRLEYEVKTCHMAIDFKLQRFLAMGV